MRTTCRDCGVPLLRHELAHAKERATRDHAGLCCDCYDVRLGAPPRAERKKPGTAAPKGRSRRGGAARGLRREVMPLTWLPCCQQYEMANVWWGDGRLDLYECHCGAVTNGIEFARRR